MKFSLLAAALILAIAWFFGWQDHRKLAAVRESHGRLFEEARALGLSTDGLVKDGKAVLPAKTGRGEVDGSGGTDPKDFAVRLAAFALRMEAAEKSGTPPDEGFQQEIFSLLDEMLQLDPSQLKVLIGELRANGELTGEMRRNIVGFAISMLANDHPAAALAIFTESSDLLSDKDGGTRVLGQALSKWASQDPAAALEWVRQNSAAHPGLVTEETKRDLIGGAAKQDPRLAFKLIGELGLDHVGDAGQEIARSAATPGERDAILSALRDHLAAADEDLADELRFPTLQALAEGAIKDGFEGATTWIDGAGLDPAEITTMTQCIEHWRTRDDTGKWIDWMAGKVPADQLSTKIGELVGQWTREDYEAAGLWLDGSADGPAKQAAVESYARTVAPYDPAAAEQWARTLPPGGPREELLRGIAEAKEPRDGEPGRADPE
jgi:hypothetical protein